MPHLLLVPWLIWSLLPSGVAAELAGVQKATAPARHGARAADPLAPLDGAMAAAEISLREGELQVAESRYRAALQQSWMLLGALELADGRLAGAREAFRRASTAAVDADAALQSLALVHLQMGTAADAVPILSRLAGANPKDVRLRGLLAQALAATGRPEEAAQELEEVRGAAPGDPELAFVLASAYLRVKRVEAAARLFDEVARARPMAETYVLIGRTYRDFDQYDRARAAFGAALARDPRVRRAHYYLGTVALLEEGVVRLDEAIAEFEKELKLAPNDPLTSLRLGMALVERRQPAAALPHLQIAGRSEPAPAEAFYYLGRAQLALDAVPAAVTSLKRALALAAAAAAPEDKPASSRTSSTAESRLAKIHYQLAVALRRAGATEEAAAHFAEAERASASETELARESLARYFADAPDPHATGAAAGIVVESSPFSALAAPERQALARRVKTAQARAYLNVGVLHAQAQRFGRAAELFEQAAEAEPNFPQVQYSLGVAYFNAQQYEKATAPLARALGSDPSQADARRMLALCWLNLEAYDKAAALLKDDPRRDTDPSLQYAYALALVRTDRAGEADEILARLLATHGASPELSVALGQSRAQQGDYEAAIQTLQRAIALKADVREAHATLGTIYLQQGRLPEAEAALRAELRISPSDLKTRYNLATVLDLLTRRDEAVLLLRRVIQSKPDHADAHYLLGKILLAQGSAAEAVEYLEAAVRLAPDEGNVHYQLAQAYTKLGRTDAARQHFDRYQQIKEKRRGQP